MARRSTPSASNGWKVSLPCTRIEAEQLKEDLPVFALLESPPALITSERDPSQAEQWQLDAYFTTEPSGPDIERLRSLVPSAAGVSPVIERIDDQDWVSLSQQALQPFSAGRFFVHTPAHRAVAPDGAISLEIEAGRAFGTGHHETTTGCLMALDALKRGGARFSDILDLGTGTGLLAFAAHRLWPTARIIASDIDPIAIEVARDNARINRIALGRAPGQIEPVVASGLRNARLRARAPYDLIAANILAGPLIDLAPSVAGALAPGGMLILAGLLDHQAPGVTASYRRQGLTPSSSIPRGEWPTLLMRKRRRIERTR
jgi:ribosomal protein L11 methyltransferase